jgi:hypothetical protein
MSQDFDTILGRNKRPELYVYLDDSGTRNPDRKPNLDKDGCPYSRDAFALGGIIVLEEDIKECISAMESLRLRWPKCGDRPFHSSEIRNRNESFAWLEESQVDCNAFYSDIGRTLCSLPVIGMACVIDRPGYNKRYMEMYGVDRWRMCKTAYAICLERTMKMAKRLDRYLRVIVERTGKREDNNIRRYHKDIVETGSPFDRIRSEPYDGLGPDDYINNVPRQVFFETKDSVMMQIADLYLHPLVVSGYDRNHIPYTMMRRSKKIMDCHVPEESVKTLGIKYSCFDS